MIFDFWCDLSIKIWFRINFDYRFCDYFMILNYELSVWIRFRSRGKGHFASLSNRLRNGPPDPAIIDSKISAVFINLIQRHCLHLLHLFQSPHNWFEHRPYRCRSHIVVRLHSFRCHLFQDWLAADFCGSNQGWRGSSRWSSIFRFIDYICQSPCYFC